MYEPETLKITRNSNTLFDRLTDGAMRLEAILPSTH